MRVKYSTERVVFPNSIFFYISNPIEIFQLIENLMSIRLVSWDNIPTVVLNSSTHFI